MKLGKKVIGVVALCLVLANAQVHGLDVMSLFQLEWLFGMSAGLVLLTLYVKFQYGLGALLTLKFLAMPVGFLVSLLLLINVNEMDFFLIATGLFPALVGATVAALCSDADPQAISGSRWSSSVDPFVFVACIGFIFFVVANDLKAFLNFPAMLFCWLMPLGVFCFLSEAKSIANRILEASLYGFLLVAALNVITYFALVSEVIAKEDVTRSYAQVASMIVNSVFSLLVYLLALLFALVRAAIEENLRANWHVAEAYVFVIFLYFAPVSILESLY